MHLQLINAHKNSKYKCIYFMQIHGTIHVYIICTVHMHFLIVCTIFRICILRNQLSHNPNDDLRIACNVTSIYVGHICTRLTQLTRYATLGMTSVEHLHRLLEVPNNESTKCKAYAHTRLCFCIYPAMSHMFGYGCILYCFYTDFSARCFA